MKKIVIVDDMESARNMLSIFLKEYSDLEIVASFSNGRDCVEYLEHSVVDLIFMDIEMPEMGGIELAEEIQRRGWSTFIIFVTAYPDYSLEAWKTNAIGYLVKPFCQSEIDAVIQRFFIYSPVCKHYISVQCFPNFAIKISGRAVAFKSEKAKEILAYLVYQKGAWVRNNEICAEVLEDLDGDRAKDSFRSYMSRLKKTLEQNDISYILEQEYGQCRICSDLIDCDYYHYLNGERDLFVGEFLKSYEWAEVALASMQLEL